MRDDRKIYNLDDTAPSDKRPPFHFMSSQSKIRSEQRSSQAGQVIVAGIAIAIGVAGLIAAIDLAFMLIEWIARVS